MMTLKDEVSTARSETKEKIMQMQFIEKEKEMLEMQIADLKNQIKRHDEELDQIQAQKKQMEIKIETNEETINKIKAQHNEDLEQQVLKYAKLQETIKSLQEKIT